MDPKITRQEVKDRAHFWLDNPNITYSQDAFAANQLGNSYRTDCSGYVSMALALGVSPSTVTFGDYLDRIEASELRTGDILGVIGEGTGGDNGHITLFIQWLDEARTTVQTWEHGGGFGSFAHPHAESHQLADWTHTGSNGTKPYLPYRYRHISEEVLPPSKLGVTALRDGDRYHVFVVGSDGAPAQRIFDGSWHPPERLGGIITGTPAVLHTDTHQFELYGIGSDGLLRQHLFIGFWLAWDRIAGGSVLGGISSVQARNGARHLFAVNADSVLYQRISTGSWHPWQALGGTVAGTPAVLYQHQGEDRYDVFATDSHGQVVQKTFLHGRWHDWHATVSGTVKPGVAACRGPGGAWHLFARGADDQLRHAFYTGTWSAWETFPGQLSCLPAVTTDDDRIDVFGLDADRELVQKTLLGQTWHGWHRI